MNENMKTAVCRFLLYEINKGNNTFVVISIPIILLFFFIIEFWIVIHSEVPVIL